MQIEYITIHMMNPIYSILYVPTDSPRFTLFTAETGLLATVAVTLCPIL